jgi:hypothetical protein
MNITHKDSYEDFLVVWGYSKPDEYSEKEKRLIYLTNEVLDLTTYCDEYSLKIGEQVLDIIKYIHYFHNRKDVYIKSKHNYLSSSNKELHYTYTVYVQFIIKYLEWGTSIHRAWFDSKKEILGYKLTPSNVAYLISWFDCTEEELA